MRTSFWVKVGLLARAIYWLGYFFLVTKLFQFQTLITKTQLTAVSLPDQHLSEHSERAQHIARYIHFADRKLLPIRLSCLHKALATQKLLAQEHISSCLCLGVKKQDNTDLAAHAWLKCGDRVVMGNGDLASYALVAAYLPDFAI